MFVGDIGVCIGDDSVDVRDVGVVVSLSGFVVDVVAGDGAV